MDKQTRDLTLNNVLECRRNLDGSFVVRVVTTEIGKDPSMSSHEQASTTSTGAFPHCDASCLRSVTENAPWTLAVLPGPYR